MTGRVEDMLKMAALAAILDSCAVQVTPFADEMSQVDHGISL
jgi:hypothetical protein